MDHKKKETGVDQVESGFTVESPLDVLAAAAAGPGVPPSQLKKQLAEVGIDVPEKHKKEKKEPPLETTGVGQVESGFLDKSPLDVLAAAAAMPGVSPHELREQLSEVGIDVPEKPKKETKHDGRLTPSEALLAKLRESGYTGDLESLKKLAEELN